MIEPPITRTLEMSLEQFTKARAHPRFEHILTLARIVNSIRFSQVAYGFDEPNTPSQLRQQVASAFYVSALLPEALKFVREVREIFRNSEAFAAEMVPLIEDAPLEKLRAGLLKRMRDKAVFHHDHAVMAGGLKLMNYAQNTFASTNGPANGDVYYDLADLAVMHFALEITPDEDFHARTQEALSDIARAAVRLSAGAESVITEFLLETSCTTPGRKG